MKIPVLLSVLALAAGGALAHVPADGRSRAAAADPQAKKEVSQSPRKETRNMGAAAAVPLTDLEAPARQIRIEQAYTRWQALRR